MRTARCFAPPQLGSGFYHCVSRVVDRRFIFGDVEKADFIILMRMYERLCGVRVLTYCLMSNHFHLLVEVPPKPEAAKMPSETDLLELIEKVYGKERARMLRQEWAEWRQIAPDGHGDARVREAVERWLSRMWDISAFMKILKQRFTQWYNTKNARKGTLWEERFKSTLVQGGDALAMVAAYIDLNPVRAGIVKDAEDYRWSGYGASCGGVKVAKMCLGRVMELSSVKVDPGNSKSVMREYRKRLLLWGVEQGATAAGKPVKRGMDRQEAAKELERTSGEMSPRAMLMCRIRYFTEGVAIGSREFAEQMFSEWRDRFGPKRKDGARKVKGLDPGLGVFALRNLG